MNKKILIAIIAILAVSIAGTGVYYALFAGSPLSHRGTVVFQSDVADVTVTLLGLEEIKTGVIGEKKEITFTGLPDGDYQAIAAKEGYTLHHMLGMSITKGGRITVPIYMMPIPSEQPLLVSTNPNAIVIKQGSSGIIAVTVTSLNDYAGSVSLSCTQLPSGVTASFNPASASVTAGGKTALTLTLTVSSTAAKGIYSVYFDVSYGQGGTGGLGPLLQVS